MKGKLIERENWEGKSSTITVGFVDRSINEPELCAFLMSVKGVSMPLAVRLVPNTKRFPPKHECFGRRRAFITMANMEQATKCVQKLNDTEIKKQKVSVVAAAPSNKVESALAGQTSWIAFTNLSRKVTEQDILSLMQKIGVSAPPKAVQLSQHPTREEWRGKAEVHCASPKDAALCASKLKLTKLKGFRVWCAMRPARKPMDRMQKLKGKGKRVVVRMLHFSATQSDVETLADEFGNIASTKLWFDRVGYPLGCATVTMDTAEEATAAVEGLSGKAFKGLTLQTAYGDGLKTRGKESKRAKKAGAAKKVSGAAKKAKQKKLKKTVMKNKKVIKKLTKDMDKMMKVDKKPKVERMKSITRRDGKRRKGRLDGVGSDGSRPPKKIGGRKGGHHKNKKGGAKFA